MDIDFMIIPEEVCESTINVGKPADELQHASLQKTSSEIGNALFDIVHTASFVTDQYRLQCTLTNRKQSISWTKCIAELVRFYQ